MMRTEDFSTPEWRFRFAVIAVVALIAVTSVLFDFNNNPTAAVSVTYYGISDELRSLDAGKIQTYVELDRDTQKEILTPAGRTALAAAIADQVDFTEGLTNLYRAAPKVLLSTSTMQMIKEGVAAENDNFRTYRDCMREIARDGHYATIGNLKMAMVSELKYQDCPKNKNWEYAFAHYSFFNLAEGGIICVEDGSPLFLANTYNGEVSLDLAQC